MCREFPRNERQNSAIIVLLKDHMGHKALIPAVILALTAAAQTPGKFAVAIPGSQEQERRVAYANSHFAASQPGSHTDRGFIYIAYGPPDEIESHPSSINDRTSFPWEEWRYRYIDGVGTNVLFRFVDSGLNGDYPLSTNSGVLPMQVRVGFYKAGEASTLTEFTISFAEADLRFRADLSYALATVNIDAVIRTPSGHLVTGFADDLNVERPTVPLFASRGMAVYKKTVPLPPGTYSLSVVAKDKVADITASYEAPFTVPAAQ